MNKKLGYKVLALALSAVSVASVAACGGTEVVGGGDKTKTQLHISAYESGYGTDWLESYARDFEERYKDKSFENGKTGVEVSVNWNADSYANVIGKIAVSTNAIYLNNVNYFEVANSGLAMDLTDVLAEPLTEFNEEASIVSKLDQQQKDYYTSLDGKYYGIPSYETYEGIYYDMDLFEDPSYGGFYLAEGGGYTTGVNGAPAKSKGPDNEVGTYDDGMPVTFDEFFALLDRMVSRNVIPFVWTGLYTYADMLTGALWENNAGDEMKINFTFDGTATDLVTVSKGVVTPIGDTKITPENGYMLQKSESIYRALEFVRKLVNNDSYYYVESFSKSFSHIGAQERYLYSRFDATSKPIAFLVEGSYWQSEARGIFNSINSEYAQNDEYSFENRRYGMMAIPFYSNEVAAKRNYQQTTVANSQTMFVKKDLSEGVKNAATTFVKYMYSQDMLKRFLIDTHFTWGVKFDLTPEEKAELPAFALASYEKKTTSNVLYPYSTSKFWMKNYTKNLKWWPSGNYAFQATSLNSEYTNPVYNFQENSKLTPEQYFNAMSTTMTNRWKQVSY